MQLGTHSLNELLEIVRNGSAFVLITTDGMAGTFPDERINRVLALALLARCGMDRERAIRVVKDADREHRDFANANPHLKEH